MSTSGVSSRGPRAVVVKLSAAERLQLERWARRPKSAQALAQRSRIVLACAEGESNQRVAARLGVSLPTVRKWRGRFAAERLDGLVDGPRPGRPRSVTDEQAEEVIVRTLQSAPPDGGRHWSTRQMARASGLSQTTISKLWRAFGLQPHRVEHWKLSKGPCVVDEVSDILGP
ncbi:MAG: IS630 family transposase [Gaiellaceae bacterium]